MINPNLCDTVRYKDSSRDIWVTGLITGIGRVEAAVTIQTLLGVETVFKKISELELISKLEERRDL